MSYRKNKLVFSLSLLLVIGFLVTSLTSYFVSNALILKQIQSNELPITSDNVYSVIQRDLLGAVFISSLMATDTFLRDWVIQGEKDDGKITRYLKEIQTKYNTSTSFFVSDNSMIYYQADGILKKVSPDEERDRWYFRVREMKADYELNVDPDMANGDEMSVFVNYKVYNYDGDYIGATGVGLQVNAVKRLINNYQKRFKSNIYLVDGQGNIKFHGLSFPYDVNNIKDIKGLSVSTEDVLSAGEKSFSYKDNGKTVYMHSRYIPELDLYLLVEQNAKESIGQIVNTLVVNLAVCLLITVVVLLLTKISINRYQEQIETLTGIIPICMYCKNIKKDKDSWARLEEYIEEHSDANFSHGICPDCMKREREKIKRLRG